MNLKKIILILFIITILSMTFLAPSIMAAPVSPRNWDRLTENGDLRASSVTAKAAILMDAHTGAILYSKNIDKIMYPASITKIMTALLAIENKELSDKVALNGKIEIAIDDLIGQGAALCGFVVGQTYTIEELLYGLMLRSGADAAVALAINTAGSLDEFNVMMNEKAKEIGMEKTNFENPHGLFGENHVTTARDMALLTRYAKQYPVFNKIVATVEYTFTSGKWKNSNLLITDDEVYGYDYATGVKTGYIQAAGHTLVTSAQKGDMSLIGVVFKEEKFDKWTSSITMHEYGFEFWDTVDVANYISNEPIDIIIENAGAEGMIGEAHLEKVCTKKEFLTFPKALLNDIIKSPDVFEETITYTQETFEAPIARGDVLGHVDYTFEGEIIYSADLVSMNNVDGIPVVTPLPKITAKPNKFSNDPNSEPRISSLTRNTVFILTLLVVVLVLIILVILINKSTKNIQYAKRKSEHKRESRKSKKH